MTVTNPANESVTTTKSTTITTTGSSDDFVESKEENIVRVQASPARLVDNSEVYHETEESYPSMTFALFVYWIIPLIFIAVFSRKVVDTSVPKINMVDRPELQPQKAPASRPTTSKQMKRPTDKPQRRQEEFPTQWPTAYRKELNAIRNRRRPIDGFDGGIYSLLEKVANTTHSKSTSTKKESVTIDVSGETKKNPSYSASNANSPARSSRSGSGDAIRDRFRQQIQSLQSQFQQNPNDIYVAITLADTMRMYDIQFHEGGTYEQDAMKLFHQIIELAMARRNEMISAGQATDVCPTPGIQSVSDEVTLDYPSKSIDGLLCGIYTSLGKLYFMANMFERAVESYDKCLRGTIQQPYYLDALNSRASSLIVLGKLEEAS
jgi:tetratricopeptide (TPR) repeat protein